MARYEVLQKSFINGVIYYPAEPGAPAVVVEYDGFPGDNLKPMDAEGKSAAAQNPQPAQIADRQKAMADSETQPKPLKPTK
jgi:hypothetical protein